MNNYIELVRYREDIIDGIGDWMWPKTDHGAWDGPKDDWKNHKECILKYTKNKRGIIQAGGNCGLYPRLLSNIFEFVYTFEPDALNFHCLVNNCTKDNIIKYNTSLGPINEYVSIDRISMENVGMHKIKKEEKNIIPSIQLDSLYFENIDCIWLDVEGMEHSVLEGSKNLIKKYFPLVICERGNDYIYKLLKDCNEYYEVVDKSHADVFYKVV